MKKLLVILCLICSHLCTSEQYLDVLEHIKVGLYPGDYSAGSIKRNKLTSDGIETFLGKIAVGDILNYRYVAWADFDLRQIPKGIKIDGANIYFNVTESTSSSSHNLFMVYYSFTITQNSSNNYYCLVPDIFLTDVINCCYTTCYLDL